MLARHFELAALVLDFVEQPHVLDSDDRLVGECGDQRNLVVGEWSHDAAHQDHHADWNSFPQERHAEHGARTYLLVPFFGSEFRINPYISDVDDSAFQRGP